MNDLDPKIEQLYRQGRYFISTLYLSEYGLLDMTLVWNMLWEFVRLAENIIDIPNQGSTKHKIVMELWKQANTEFKITEIIEKSIPDKIKVWKFNVPLKWIDIDKIIDKIIIPVIVLVANRLGWNKGK